MHIPVGILFPLLTLLLLVTAACGASAQATDGQRAIALVNAGLIAAKAGRTTEATDDYHKALALDPRNKIAYYDLGVIDQGAGRNASAELEYRTAIQYDPNFADALYNLAVLRMQPAPAEAIALYRQVITIQPTYASAHLNLGFLLIAAGQKVEGKAELDRAVALNPLLASRIPTPTPSPKH
jgi:tetratricopeptide (TPR) repeat protein